MSTLDGSDYTLCPSNKSTLFPLIRKPPSHLSEKSSTTKFVKYINPATYIERSFEASDRGFSDGEEANVDDAFEGVETINTSSEMTSPRTSVSRVRICKIEENTEIELERKKQYEEWLKKKMEVARERKLMFKANEERKEKQEELRRQKSREKVLEWMSKKSASSSTKTSEKDVKFVTVETLQIKTKSDDERNFEAWLRKKEEEEFEEMARHKRESFQQAQYDLYKQCLSSAFYNKWLYLTRDKPRPVPLNQGFASLAGSTSNIYVNPKPWNHI